MKQKTGESTRTIYHLKTVPFAEIPAQSKLFLDFQTNAPQIKKFYPNKQIKPKEFIAKILENYSVDRNRLADALRRINTDFAVSRQTLENIERLRENDSVAVVTGQQAGLFSGAIYTIYKALSAVKLAENLKKQNVNAVPVFWIAEEDHDFEEIKKTFNLDKNDELSESVSEPKNLPDSAPVGFIEIGENINQTIEKLLADLPHTEFTGEIETLLRETYQSEETYSAAFAKFLAKIFRNYGLIFLAPLDAELKKLCAPIFTKAVEKAGEINEKLLRRNDELAAANYHAQVLVEKDSFPFFLIGDGGERQALRRSAENGKIKIAKTKNEISLDELKRIAETAPEKLSPNALLRPVAQDFLLPTILYFGGAAEIAYFAQNEVIYQTLNRPVTPIRHRASFTVVEPRNRRTLEKYELKLIDLFGDREKLVGELVEKFLDGETAAAFDEVEKNIDEQIKFLAKKLSISEPTLADNLANRRQKILWHIGALRKKYHRAETVKDQVFERRVETLFNSLLPRDALQERTLNVVTFLNRHGANFIEWIYEAVDVDEKDHQILIF